MITGVRHRGPLPSSIADVQVERRDECFCGCQFVVGLPGTVMEDTSDAPKLAQLDPPLLIASFEVPSPAGGPSRTEEVAYTFAEVGLDAPRLTLFEAAA